MKIIKRKLNEPGKTKELLELFIPSTIQEVEHSTANKYKTPNASDDVTIEANV